MWFLMFFQVSIFFAISKKHVLKPQQNLPRWFFWSPGPFQKKWGPSLGRGFPADDRPQEAEKCQLSEAELRGFVAEAEIDSSGASV